MKRKKTRKSSIFTSYHDAKLIELLKSGGVGILPTDTLYGIVGSALNPDSVKRIYELKGRDKTKPSIILIGGIEQLDLFGISERDKQWAAKYWPGPVSIILRCSDKAFEYIHRGKESLAFRLPNTQALWELLEQTGPLIAPSANPQGEVPAHNIKQARNYFADKVDFYLDNGELAGEPSRLVSLLGKVPRILRN